MYSLRQWHTIHITRVPRLHENVGYTAQSHFTHQCTVMARQNILLQTIKNSLTKAMEGGEDLHLAILSYITTPLNYSLPSPAELLNSRKFRCSLSLWIEKQNHTQQYMKVMQHQKHQQIKQESQGSTQSTDWRYSTHPVSTKCEEVGPWDHYWNHRHTVIQSEDSHGRSLFRNRKLIKIKTHRLWAESPRLTREAQGHMMTIHIWIDPKESAENHRGS